MTPQNRHTPKNINICGTPQSNVIQKLNQKKNAPSLRMYQTVSEYPPFVDRDRLVAVN